MGFSGPLILFLALLGLSWLDLDLSWLLVGRSWLMLGLLARLGPLLPLHGVILGPLLTHIGSLLAHPVPAVPHLEPPLSRHKDSLASSWSLSWPIRLPPPLIFPSAVASGCMINSDPSWRFRFWTHVKPAVPHSGGSHETVALPCIVLGFLSRSSRVFSIRVLTKGCGRHMLLHSFSSEGCFFKHG